MSAPSILAKNLRTVGQGLCLVARGCARSWDRVAKSPYRRLVLGITFGILPASVAIATYSAYPSERKLSLRFPFHPLRTKSPL